MRTETPPPVDPEHTEPPTDRSPGDDVPIWNLSPTHLVETIPPHHTPSLVLLTRPIATTEHATFHCTPTSESNADSPMAVIKDIHTTHETTLCIDTPTTIVDCPSLLIPEHTAGPLEVHADV